MVYNNDNPKNPRRRQAFLHAAVGAVVKEGTWIPFSSWSKMVKRVGQVTTNMSVHNWTGSMADVGLIEYRKKGEGKPQGIRVL